MANDASREMSLDDFVRFADSFRVDSGRHKTKLNFSVRPQWSKRFLTTAALSLVPDQELPKDFPGLRLPSLCESKEGNVLEDKDSLGLECGISAEPLL
jgi:hypothetical protein